MCVGVCASVMFFLFDADFYFSLCSVVDLVDNLGVLWHNIDTDKKWEHKRMVKAVE